VGATQGLSEEWCGARSGCIHAIDPPNTPVTMYTTRWCGDCRSARRVLAEHGIAYTEINIDHDAEGREIVKRINRGNRSVPTIVFPSGAVLVEPSPPELEARLREEGLLG